MAAISILLFTLKPPWLDNKRIMKKLTEEKNKTVKNVFKALFHKIMTRPVWYEVGTHFSFTDPKKYFFSKKLPFKSFLSQTFVHILSFSYFQSSTWFSGALEILWTAITSPRTALECSTVVTNWPKTDEGCFRGFAPLKNTHPYRAQFYDLINLISTRS